MQTQKSIKYNRYKFKPGDYAWIIDEEHKNDSDKKVLIRVKKRLIRPFTASENFYICEHQVGSRRFNKVHYESEMEELEDYNELM
jgi:hypothetical protein